MNYEKTFLWISSDDCLQLSRNGYLQLSRIFIIKYVRKKEQFVFVKQTDKLKQTNYKLKTEIEFKILNQIASQFYLFYCASKWKTLCYWTFCSEKQTYFSVCLQEAKSNIPTAKSIYILKCKPKIARIYGPCYSKRKEKLHVIKYRIAIIGLRLMRLFHHYKNSLYWLMYFSKSTTIFFSVYIESTNIRKNNNTNKYFLCFFI